MLRHRFGRLAASVAVVYTAAAVLFGVVALVTGDGALLARLLTFGQEKRLSAGWGVPVGVLIAAFQGWALWQILRGRPAGPAPAAARSVRALRVVLYLNAALGVVDLVPVDLPWWSDLVIGTGGLVLAGLFFVVLRGSARVMAALAAAALALTEVSWVGSEVADHFDVPVVERAFDVAGLYGLPWILGMALLLIAQTADGRWSRATVWTGFCSEAVPYLLSPLATRLLFALADDGAGPLMYGLAAATTLLAAVWQARSAHELAGPPPEQVARAARPGPVPLRSRTLAVAAVALPLLPLAVALLDGTPPWSGGGMWMFSAPEGPLGFVLAALTSLVDTIAGVGALSALVLAAVLGRRPGLVRATVLVLLAAAAVEVVIAFPSLASLGDPGPAALPDESGTVYDTVSYFSSGFGSDGGHSGVARLWVGGAFAAAAVLLPLSLHRLGGRPRPRLRMVTTAAAVAVPLCFLAVADHGGGPVTAVGDCAGSWPGGRERVAPTGERAFVCAVRASSGALKVAPDLPDRFLVAYGRRLCDVHTRNDPAELARVLRTDGVQVRELNHVLAEICPSAAVVVAAAREQEEREMREWEEERRRVCATARRPRPRIRPVTRVVQRDPVSMPDYGALEAYEPDIAGEDYYEENDLSYSDDLLAVGQGFLGLSVHSDVPLCVTTETYTRRPPVEIRGWQRVVEVGYPSVSGEIRFAHPLGGDPLPDLAVRGRGHYRIRIHYSWDRSKDGGAVRQRLLIMSYPGRGDRVVVHRKPVER
ncbi:hypothetical protein [Microtetraspora niveoalba]|uniref:hypothetical protein n=1 Tax=Microtetraspora niveoalba TaxID=46175 RepID=UPI00082AFE8C|nr:hypothetical protein [Microtetraspora niveoalba]